MARFNDNGTQYHIVYLPEGVDLKKVRIWLNEEIGIEGEVLDIDIIEDEELVEIAAKLNQQGIKKIDSLHIACAIKANADFFLTTDDGVLKKASIVKDIKITDPIGFIKEVSA